MGLIGENGDEYGEIGMIYDLGQDRKERNREEEEEEDGWLCLTTASDGSGSFLPLNRDLLCFFFFSFFSGFFFFFMTVL